MELKLLSLVNDVDDLKQDSEDLGFTDRGNMAKPFEVNDGDFGESGALRSGLALGKIHGFDVYMSNTVSTAGTSSTIPGAIFHKSAAVFASQQEVRVQSEYSVDALGTKVVADLLYGCKIIDDSDNKKGVKFTNVD